MKVQVGLLLEDTILREDTIAAVSAGYSAQGAIKRSTPNNEKQEHEKIKARMKPQGLFVLLLSICGCMAVPFLQWNTSEKASKFCKDPITLNKEKERIYMDTVHGDHCSGKQKAMSMM